MRIMKRVVLLCLTFVIMVSCTGCMSKKNKSRVAFYFVGQAITLEEHHTNLSNEILAVTKLTDSNEAYNKIHNEIIPKLDELIVASEDIGSGIRLLRLKWIHMMYTDSIKKMKEAIDVDIDEVPSILGNEELLKKSLTMSNNYYGLLGGLVMIHGISVEDIDFEVLAKDYQKDILKGLVKDAFNEVKENIEDAS